MINLASKVLICLKLSLIIWQTLSDRLNGLVELCCGKRVKILSRALYQDLLKEIDMHCSDNSVAAEEHMEEIS